MATDLVTTGPPMMDLRWGQTERERDGARERTFRPGAAYQEARGYLHPGVLAAAVLGAARTTIGLPTPVRSVSVALHRLVPLGTELRARANENGDDVRIQLFHHGDVGRENEPVELLATGEVLAGDPTAPPNLGELRSLADVPVPQPEDHDLYAGCWVCGGDNPQGLSLLPGWHAPDTVVTGFVANERMSENGSLSPALTAALLTCPTLWACREQLDVSGTPAAALTSYEVTFLDDAPTTGSLRTVGLAGEPTDELAGRPTDERFRGSSALIAESGAIHAVAQASWIALEEEPAREPGREPPIHEFMPLKGGRPEDHSPEEYGQPLPGRREKPGPRSERPDDHDARRSQDFSHRSTGPDA